MVPISQAVILCGGIGSRLGVLTATTPKPLLPVAGRPFLERLMFEIKRHGPRRFLLLAAHLSEELERFASQTASLLNIEVKVCVEPGRAGTGGALWHARHELDARFFLFNGDSWFDINLLDLALMQAQSPGSVLAMALRPLEDARRFGIVELDQGRVTRFGDHDGRPGPALVNGGVYVVSHRLVDHLSADCSLERDVLKPLAAAAATAICGRVYDRFFIDIGIPPDYERAQDAVPAQQRRPAVFFDRDGVLNADHGYVGHMARFDWLPGAISAIKSINDLGYFAFVVTNQAGVAKGHYSEADVQLLHNQIQAALATTGAHIDDFRYCPFHPEGSVVAYARVSDWRKPAPGMLLDLLAHWPVDVSASIMIGDQPSDVQAGESAGMRAQLVRSGENVGQMLAQML